MQYFFFEEINLTQIMFIFKSLCGEPYKLCCDYDKHFYEINKKISAFANKKIVILLEKLKLKIL